jgi:tetratricopeptide (TPR) repeat protein
MSDFPYIFTFYSYKGGVGRSMALLNTAYALAGRGRNVLVIDADLEAPGLSEFLTHTEGELAGRSELDVVDLISWAFHTAGVLGKDADRDDLELADAPILASYAAPAPPDQLRKVAPRIGWLGRLDFVVGDLDRDYFRRLEHLGLAGRSREDLIRAGSVLKRYLKTRRAEVTFPGLEDLYGPEEVPYDYVLVDSRTGLTETGGLCIGPLAERLVVLTALNDQNVHGTQRFLQLVGADQPREDVKEPWDSADVPPSAPEAPPRLAPKPTLVVASLLPPGELDYKQQRLEEVRNSIGRVAATLSYHPRMAVAETIFVRDWSGEYLAMEYHHLADQMMAAIDDHAVQLAARSQKLRDEENRRADAVEAVIRLTPHRPDVGEALLRDLGNRFEPTGDADFRTFNRLYACLSEEKARDREKVLNNWGNALVKQGKTKQGAEADALFEKACAKYAEAVRIKADYPEAFYNWGTALSAQAKTKQGAEADGLFQKAYAKYAEAVRIKPDDHEAFYNWGTALLEQGRKKQGAEADNLFGEAHARLGRAEEIRPGAGSYNLACVAALRGRGEECREWLTKARDTGALPSAEKLATDSDLDGVRKERWFQELLSSR